VTLGKWLSNGPAGQFVLTFMVAQYLRLVHATTRWSKVDSQLLTDPVSAGRPVIAIMWHGRLLMAPYVWPRPQPLHLLVSRHGDGEYFARVMAQFGLPAVRGSTAREDKDRDKGGAPALREMLGLLKQGLSVGITPDGPRGPRMRLAMGIVTLARLSGAPVVPIAFATSHRRLLGSWDRFHLAWPFGRGAMVYGRPIVVARDLDAEQQEAARLEIEAALNAVTDRADLLVGQDTVEPAAAPVTAGQGEQAA
jgi:hypothetical protein